jgi:hypothetical protein
MGDILIFKDRKVLEVVAGARHLGGTIMREIVCPLASGYNCVAQGGAGHLQPRHLRSFGYFGSRSPLMIWIF